jgi:DNA mismatch repair ATPase MutS
VLTAAFVIVVMLMVLRPGMLRPMTSLLMLIIAAQYTVAARARRYLKKSLGHAADLFPELAAVTDVLGAVVAEPPIAGRFGEIQRALVSDGALVSLARLSRLFEWSAVQHSPMLHAALNAVVAFDAHLAAAIDAWHAAFASRVPPWIDLAGEAEALIALATLAHENPGWVMPRVHDEASPFVAATGCGHPLIADATRVTNPVALDAAGTAVVISGSNMAGKTTYLRAIGLNALLALAGGPVCASAFAVRRSRVRTTVRVEDDLGAGVSLFLAEVSRLRDVVADAAAPNEAPVLFLLDEILHGTNAEDRRQATRLVLARLLAAGASGIITTHDPRIAEATEGRVAQGHFTDAVASNDGEVKMTFDYTLRPGPATTTNALRILEALGLNGESGMGTREWGIGNRESGIGNRE